MKKFAVRGTFRSTSPTLRALTKSSNLFSSNLVIPVYNPKTKEAVLVTREGSITEVSDCLYHLEYFGVNNPEPEFLMSICDRYRGDATVHYESVENLLMGDVKITYDEMKMQFFHRYVDHDIIASLMEAYSEYEEVTEMYARLEEVLGSQEYRPLPENSIYKPLLDYYNDQRKNRNTLPPIGF